MEELFGIEMTRIAWVMSGLFAAIVLLVVALSLKNRVLFALGTRNLPRRKQETILIILGLMLATMITSAAFITGDTITYSIRSVTVDGYGEIDEIVQISGDVSGQSTESGNFYAESWFDEIAAVADGQEAIEFVAPAIFVSAPLLSQAERLSVPSALVVGAEPAGFADFGVVNDATTGEPLDLNDLTAGDVYMGEETAEELNTGPGGEVLLYLAAEPVLVRVRALHDADGVYMPLDDLQTLLGREGQINQIYVSNAGGPLDGAAHSDTVKTLIDPVLEGSNLEIRLVKKDTLALGEAAGSAIVAIFVLFGLFSIAAGMLLIFLIFVMLAAERKPEMGMARAVGMQRRHLVQSFLIEGTVYDLIAAGVGSIVGILVSIALVRVMAAAIGQAGDDFPITFHAEPRSVLVAYTVGMVLTFIVVTISAWRVSVLNIVRAIRDLPEPQLSKKSIRGTVISAVMVAGGALLTWVGITTEVLFSFLLGTSLVIIGAGLLSRRFGAPDRAAYTFAGAGLLTWWLLPASVFERILPDVEFSQGLEMFFLTGIMLVTGAVWTVMYNADLVINVLMRVLGSSRQLAPILKMAVSFPLYSRFRTGLTLSMFALVIFTLIFMAVIIDVNSLILRERDRITGGADVSASVAFLNDIDDLPAAIAAHPDLDAGNYLKIGAVSSLPGAFRQVGTESVEGDRWRLRGVDDGYITGRQIGMRIVADGYEDADAVWEAIRTTPGIGVVSANVVPSRNNFNVGFGGTDFRLEGVLLEDPAMQPIDVEFVDQTSGQAGVITVIGVIDDLSFFSAGLYVSQRTVEQMTHDPPAPTSFVMEIPDGVDQDQAAKALESAFLENGLQTQVLDAVLAEQQASSRTFNSLFQGFMGLGLLVGIAALGVIGARAVVERRRQIGALRAIGFQSSMVLATFLLESSFIAILGIALGVVLGLAMAIQVTGYIVEDLGVQGAGFNVPWATIIFVIVVAYVASLITTVFPAWQASRVYPSEALRYE